MRAPTSSEFLTSRKRLGLTQEEMAEALNLSVSSVRNYEKRAGENKMVPLAIIYACRWLVHQASIYHYLINFELQASVIEGGAEEARAIGFQPSLWDKNTRCQFWRETEYARVPRMAGADAIIDPIAVSGTAASNFPSDVVAQLNAILPAKK